MSKRFTVEMLPAREGDCIWIEYGSSHAPSRILIDGGRQIAYDTLKERFESLSDDQREFELLVCTHVDADHIEGLLKLIEDENLNIAFKDVWFNGYSHLVSAAGLESFGAKQGERLSKGIVDHGWNWNAAFSGDFVAVNRDGSLPVTRLAGGLKLTLLSPTVQKLAALKPVWRKEVEKAGMVPGVPSTKEPPEGVERFGGLSISAVEEMAALRDKKDSSKANGSSISLIAEFDGKRILLAGDAHADVMVDGIKSMNLPGRLKLDAFKLSHHGSRGTISSELLELIECDRFLISSDGSRHDHPDREAISKIIVSHSRDKEFFGNYRSESMLEWNLASLKNHFKFSIIVPDDSKDGLIGIGL